MSSDPSSPRDRVPISPQPRAAPARAAITPMPEFRTYQMLVEERRERPREEGQRKGDPTPGPRVRVLHSPLSPPPKQHSCCKLAMRVHLFHVVASVMVAGYWSVSSFLCRCCPGTTLRETPLHHIRKIIGRICQHPGTRPFYDDWGPPRGLIGESNL